MHILLRQITVTAITQDLKQAPHARRCRRQFWQNPAGLPARRVLRKYRGPFLEFSHVAGRCSTASGARAAPRPELAIKCGLPAVAVAEDYGCSAAG